MVSLPFFFSFFFLSFSNWDIDMYLRRVKLLMWEAQLSWIVTRDSISCEVIFFFLSPAPTTRTPLLSCKNISSHFHYGYDLVSPPTVFPNKVFPFHPIYYAQKEGESFHTHRKKKCFSHSPFQTYFLDFLLYQLPVGRELRNWEVC